MGPVRPRVALGSRCGTVALVALVAAVVVKVALPVARDTLSVGALELTVFAFLLALLVVLIRVVPTVRDSVTEPRLSDAEAVAALPLILGQLSVGTLAGVVRGQLSVGTLALLAIGAVNFHPVRTEANVGGSSVWWHGHAEVGAVVFTAGILLCQHPRAVDLHVHRSFHVALQHHDALAAVLVGLIDCFACPVVPKDKSLLLEDGHGEGMSGFSSARDNLLEVSTVEIGRCQKIFLSVNKVDPVCPNVHRQPVRPAKQSPVFVLTDCVNDELVMGPIQPSSSNASTLVGPVTVEDVTLARVNCYAPRFARFSQLGLVEDCLPEMGGTVLLVHLQQLDLLLGPVDKVQDLGDVVESHAFYR